MNQFTRVDLGVLNKSLLGFDKLFSEFEDKVTAQLTYPPYNVIKKDENKYEIEVAVTGFDTSEISVEVEKDQLIVKGDRKKTETSENYLHRGLATRSFTRTWTMAEHMQVEGCEIKNGVLTITLTRSVPEQSKRKTLKIKT